MTTAPVASPAFLTNRSQNAAALEWEFVDCPMCGHSEFVPVIDGTETFPDGNCSVGVVRCVECCLAWTNPRPTEATIGHFYPDDYRPYRPPAVPTRRKPSRILRLPDRQPPGRLLDFGCGAGQFLREARDAGWAVQGVDVSERVAFELQEREGITVHVGTLPHPDLPAQSFDVVSMWNSLEHTHDPRRVVRAARRLLRRNGRLMIGVPNFDSWASQTFGRHWFALDLPRHLIHFTPSTLERLLESEGFRRISIEQIRRVGWLRHSARLAIQDQAALPWSRYCRWKPAATLVSHYAAWQGRADFLRVAAVVR